MPLITGCNLLKEVVIVNDTAPILQSKPVLITVSVRSAMHKYIEPLTVARQIKDKWQLVRHCLRCKITLESCLRG
jgi:hypothetical protein